MQKISILTAFFNEAENLVDFKARLAKSLENVNFEAEVVLVDDHSTDTSRGIAHQWQLTEPNVVYVRLARNSGSHAAYSAALAHCTGDCAILLAADLQDPPEAIVTLLAKWQDGFDVVWAVRSRREKEPLSTLFFSSLYYRFMRRFALPDMPLTGADFLLIDRKVINAYNAIPEKNTSFLAMILWIGFRQTSIEYVKHARNAGSSKWTLSKKLKLFIDSMVSFSYAPIRLMSLLGLLMATSGFAYAFVVILGRILGWVVAGTGFAAMMTVLLVGQGSILLMLGLLGEYLWRTFDEARGRPRYIIEEHFQARNSLLNAKGDSE